MNTRVRRDLHLRLYTHLENSCGPLHWWPSVTSPGERACPFEVCVGAILTQNAPWLGVVRSIETMLKRGIFSIEGILQSDDAALSDAIRPSIYHNQKARRLRDFCCFLRDACGGRIEPVGDDAPDTARARLLAIPGIGRETADSILLYALGMPVFVVDAYTKRIFLRHGLINGDCGYETLRGFFEDALNPDPVLYNEYHALLCHVGAVFCKPRPDCVNCPARVILGEATE